MKVLHMKLKFLRKYKEKYQRQIVKFTNKLAS